MNVIILLLLTIFASSAHACTSSVEKPAGLKLVCSATWAFQGTCTGNEMVFEWQRVSGQTTPPPGDPFIRPFDEEPIVVIGYELMRLDHHNDNKDERNNRAAWFMIGSAISGQPDVMLWLGPGERRVSRMWPAGSGQLWPGKSQANPSRLSDMIDLHGVCFGGGPVEVFVTLYYTRAHAN